MKPGPGKPRRLLNSKGGDAQTKLRGEPDSTMWLATRRGQTEAQKEEHEQALWEKHTRKCSAHLLMVIGGNAATTKVNAVCCEEKQIGTWWKPVQGLDAREAKALAVWLNSSVGRLQLMTVRGGEGLVFPRMLQGALGRVLVPTTRENAPIVQALSAAFDRYAEEPVPRYDEGYGPLRQAWDEAVVQAIPSADAGKVRRWAELLAEEPVCTGRAKG